jgi:hypothetical protein
MDLASACLAFFTIPCKFNFQKFDETQRVTLRFVNGAIDVQQNTIPPPKEGTSQENAFAAQWTKELERFVCLFVCLFVSRATEDEFFLLQASFQKKLKMVFLTNNGNTHLI